MNILADLHHLSLYNSLSLLFEQRLGHHLFRPIGMEWYQQGFWNVHQLDPNLPPIEMAKRFLSPEPYKPVDKSLPFSDYVESTEGIYVCQDNHHHCTQKALTLEAFKALPIDVVIASIPQHIHPFKQLIQAYQPQAKFIFQMGNMFMDVRNNLQEIPNLLASTIAFPVPASCNAVFYHQEFDTTVFRPLGMRPHQKITSFINVLSNYSYTEEYYVLKALLSEYDVKSYGYQCDDGNIAGIETIARLMNESQFGWHARTGDDSGHVLHNWYACGRPVITHFCAYKDAIGGQLLEDMHTCIDLDQHSLREVCDLIRHISDEQYHDMCQQALARFRRCVNYDEEEHKIRTFLDNLR